LAGCEGGGPVGELVVEGGLDVGEVEGEAVTKADFLPKAGEGGGGSTKDFRVGAGLLGEFGEIFDGEFLFDRTVLLEEFEFHEVFGAIEIEEGLGARGREFGAFQRGEETAGAAAVFGDDFVEAAGGGRGVEGAEGFGMVVEGVEKAGDVLLGIVMFDEGGQVFLLKAGKIDGDEKPVGGGIAFEGRLEATEGTGGGFQVGEEMNIGHRRLNLEL